MSAIKILVKDLSTLMDKVPDDETGGLDIYVIPDNVAILLDGRSVEQVSVTHSSSGVRHFIYHGEDDYNKFDGEKEITVEVVSISYPSTLSTIEQQKHDVVSTVREWEQQDLVKFIEDLCDTPIIVALMHQFIQRTKS